MLASVPAVCRFSASVGLSAFAVRTASPSSSKLKQYRSMIFYMDEKQKSEAEEVIELLRSKGHRVNTKLRPAEKFWEAEDYHQHYYDKTGGEPYCHIRVKKF